MITAEEAKKNTQLRLDCFFDCPVNFPIEFYMDLEGSCTEFFDVVDWNIRTKASMGRSSVLMYIAATPTHQLPNVDGMADFLRIKGFSAYVCVSGMIDMITADEARRNVESCRSVVAESPLVDVDVNLLIVYIRRNGKTLEDIVLGEIFKEISKQSYCGKNWAKIAIVDRKIVNNADFTKISSRLKDCGFDSIYGGNDKEVEMLVEW